MGSLTRVSDALYAFRFIRLLTKPFEKTKAYELGIVDANGKRLKKPSTSSEKAAYTYFHRIVFNIKRLLGKFPGGSSTIASYASALYLVKEHTGISEHKLIECMNQVGVTEPGNLQECFFVENDHLLKGAYKLLHDVNDPITGDPIARAGSKVVAAEHLEPIDTLFNAHLYEVKHPATKRRIIISAGDIMR